MTYASIVDEVFKKTWQSLDNAWPLAMMHAPNSVTTISWNLFGLQNTPYIGSLSFVNRFEFFHHNKHCSLIYSKEVQQFVGKTTKNLHFHIFNISLHLFNYKPQKRLKRAELQQ